jgi:hypothetical protein
MGRLHHISAASRLLVAIRINMELQSVAIDLDLDLEVIVQENTMKSALNLLFMIYRILWGM